MLEQKYVITLNNFRIQACSTLLIAIDNLDIVCEYVVI